MSSSTHTMQPPNPYAPPSAPLGDEPEGGLAHHEAASKSQRLVDFVVDQLTMYAAAFVVGLGVGVVGLGEELQRLPDLVFGAGAMLLYYIPLEALGGRTIGKLVTGTRVVTESGGAPGLGQVVARTLLRMVPFEPLSFLGPSGSGWHDTVSHTRVVRLRRSFLDTPAGGLARGV